MRESPDIHPPWYRQFWPWFLIAIPALSVVGGFVTLWLALSHPETLVVDEQDYRQIRSELRGQHASDGAAKGADEQR